MSSCSSLRYLPYLSFEAKTKAEREATGNNHVRSVPTSHPPPPPPPPRGTPISSAGVGKRMMGEIIISHILRTAILENPWKHCMAHWTRERFEAQRERNNAMDSAFACEGLDTLGDESEGTMTRKSDSFVALALLFMACSSESIRLSPSHPHNLVPRRLQNRSSSGCWN